MAQLLRHARRLRSPIDTDEEHRQAGSGDAGDAATTNEIGDKDEAARAPVDPLAATYAVLLHLGQLILGGSVASRDAQLALRHLASWPLVEPGALGALGNGPVAMLRADDPAAAELALNFVQRVQIVAPLPPQYKAYSAVWAGLCDSLGIRRLDQAVATQRVFDQECSCSVALAHHAQMQFRRMVGYAQRYLNHLDLKHSWHTLAAPDTKLRQGSLSGLIVQVVPTLDVQFTLEGDTVSIRTQAHLEQTATPDSTAKALHLILTLDDENQDIPLQALVELAHWCVADPSWREQIVTFLVAVLVAGEHAEMVATRLGVPDLPASIEAWARSSETAPSTGSPQYDELREDCGEGHEGPDGRESVVGEISVTGHRTSEQMSDTAEDTDETDETDEEDTAEGRPERGVPGSSLDNDRQDEDNLNAEFSQRAETPPGMVRVQGKGGEAGEARTHDADAFTQRGGRVEGSDWVRDQTQWQNETLANLKLQHLRADLRTKIDPILVSSSILLSTAARHAVGRWGEEWAYECLQATESREGAQVIWINRDCETGKPYDICIELSDGSTEFYEVKATVAEDKHFFEMSYNEWSFAQKNGAAYHIMRIMKAGDVDNAWVVRVQNPYLQWKHSELGMCVSL